METLDQSQTETDGTALRVSSTLSICQTFTSAISGVLSKVSMLFTSTSSQDVPATIKILGTTDGVPNSSDVLWTKDYDSLAQGWFDVDLSDSTIPLIEGNIYGIFLSSTDTIVGAPDDKWAARGLSPDTDFYTSGSVYEDRGSGWTTLTIGGTPRPNCDAAFKTYVTTNIPNPNNFFNFI